MFHRMFFIKTMDFEVILEKDFQIDLNMYRAINEYQFEEGSIALKHL